MLAKKKIIPLNCKLSDAKELFTKIAQKMLNENTDEEDLFSIDENNESVINELLLYFIGSNESNLDFKKGIMLTGKIGTGKSFIMRVLHYLNSNVFRVNYYKFVTSRTIIRGYQMGGYDAIECYISSNGREFPTILIDDIGSGIEIVNYFGNQSNIIAEILLERYEIFTRHGKLTHITTNLNADEIENRYGDRVRSRMREMFNVLELKGNDRRK